MTEFQDKLSYKVRATTTEGQVLYKPILIIINFLCTDIDKSTSYQAIPGMYKAYVSSLASDIIDTEMASSFYGNINGISCPLDNSDISLVTYSISNLDGSAYTSDLLLIDTVTKMI